MYCLESIFRWFSSQWYKYRRRKVLKKKMKQWKNLWKYSNFCTKKCKACKRKIENLPEGLTRQQYILEFSIFHDEAVKTLEKTSKIHEFLKYHNAWK